MNKVEMHRTEELQRRIVARRRDTVRLNTEFNRLQTQRAAAPAELREALLREIDAVAALHRAAVQAIDALTDELIRLSRGQPAGRRRPWRHRAA